MTHQGGRSGEIVDTGDRKEPLLMNRHALDGAVLLASHKDMAEMCAGGNRRALCAWLATQRVEGPGVSASLAEYIRSAIRELEKLSVAEQVARVTDLETRILSL